MGPRILVIEDEYLVALDLQVALSNAGFDVELAYTEPEALQRIEKGGLEAAVADANLNGRQIHHVAAALAEHGIPFVMVTGYGRESLPAEVAGRPLLEKPVDQHRLIETVRRLCST